MFIKYLNSVKLFESPNDQGKPEIKVESVDNRKATDNKDVVNWEDDKTNDKEDDNEDEDDDEEDDKEDDKTETDEEKKARVAQEKEERRQGRIQKRIDKLTATVGSKDAEIEALKKQLAEKPVEGLTEEEVERRAAAKAEALAAQKEADRLQKDFEKTADNLIKAANKIDKDFEKKINEVAKETSVLMPKYMVEILSDLDHKNGAEILARLADDEDLYEAICTLSERHMTKRLDKMSEELKNKGKTAKPKERIIPDPIEPINDGSNNRGNVLPKNPTQNMEEFVRIRNAQAEAYRKSKFR
jgi:hypothetical protein